MPQTIVSIENVSLFIPGEVKRTFVLNDIDWQIKKGVHCALLGPNGAGKSTLLRLIAGELWPASGRIAWFTGGKVETSPIAAKSMCALVSPMLQENCQKYAWDVTCRDILSAGMGGSPLSFAASGKLPEYAEAEINTLMEELGALEWLDMRMPALSQGQLRLVLLVRALLQKPELLLLDEYSDGLDENRKKIFFNILGRAANSMTIVFASHRRDSLPDWARETLYLHEGRLYATSQRERQDAGFEPGKLEINIMRQNHAGGEGAAHTVLSLENVSVYIDSHLVLKNINWNMRRGENWRITGANGSGKSTLLRLIAGDEFVAAGGSIRRWNAKNGRWALTLEEIRRDIVLVSDLGQALYGYDVNGLELVCSGYDNSIGIYRDFEKQEKERAYRIIEDFFQDQDADIIARTSIRRLSSGQLRRLYLARAIVTEPEILLLDEPCSGLDQQMRARYMALLDSLAIYGKGGFKPQIVLVSHYDEDAPGCITNEARMENGRLTANR